MRMGNRKLQARRMIYIGLLLGWMSVIFCFSARTAPESAQMSHSVGKMAGKLLVPGFDRWSEDRQEEFAARVDYPVRKGAHMTEYAILGILLSLTAGTLYTGNGELYDVRRRMGTAAAGGILYAVSDELHQWFVPGRSCQFTDVLIDSCGVILGVLFLELVRRRCSGKNKES